MKGEVFEGRVRDVSAKGMGVVDHPDGRVFFVPGTWPGDAGTFAVDRIEKRYGFATLQNLGERSPQRRSAPCPHHGWGQGRCGGCPWMMVDESAQLTTKEHILRHTLVRSQLSTDGVRPIWPSPAPLGYRNRIQLKTDGERLGFVTSGTKEIAPIKDCQVLTPTLRQKLKQVHETLPNDDWRPTGDHTWNFLDLDHDSPDEQWELNRRRPFRQANDQQNEAMRGWLRDRLREIPRAGLLELFAGSGNFTDAALESGHGPIHCVEASAKHAKKEGVQWWRLDLSRPSAWHRLAKGANGVQTLLLDPPRTGFAGLAKLVRLLPNLRHMLYVSCDVPSFCRDAQRLKGWSLHELQPVDQFPQTPHVELMAWLRRSDDDAR